MPDENGIFRSASAKGKGFWLARLGDQEKVFYDGVFGTSVASKNAAYKWYKTLTLGKEGLNFNDKVEEMLKWLDENKERFGVEVVKEIQGEMIERLTT